ncbi:unnamed protein product [Peniophora sp. CBMAI 1063]|nr:unnamed protein product [Peniophora sp. CBMAI 1063]
MPCRILLRQTNALSTSITSSASWSRPYTSRIAFARPSRIWTTPRAMRDGWELLGAFFKGKAGRAAMHTYLEGLCDRLYDDLRPRILHESRLSALGEIYAELRALMVFDALVSGTDEFKPDEDVEELSMPDTDGTKVKKYKGLGAPPVAALLPAVFSSALSGHPERDPRFRAQGQRSGISVIVLGKDRQGNSLPPREKDSGARIFLGAKLDRGTLHSVAPHGSLANLASSCSQRSSPTSHPKRSHSHVPPLPQPPPSPSTRLRPLPRAPPHSQRNRTRP